MKSRSLYGRFAGVPLRLDPMTGAPKRPVPPQCSTCEELRDAEKEYQREMGTRLVWAKPSDLEWALIHAVRRALATCRTCNGAPAQPETSAQPGFTPPEGSYVATPAHSVTALDDFAPATPALVHHARKSAQTLRVCADYRNGRGGGICAGNWRPWRAPDGTVGGYTYCGCCAQGAYWRIPGATCEDPGPMGPTCKTSPCAPPVRPLPPLNVFRTLCPVCAGPTYQAAAFAGKRDLWCTLCARWVA